MRQQRVQPGGSSSSRTGSSSARRKAQNLTSQPLHSPAAPRPDAIGEDMHCFIKAYSKTRGAARLYPIFAPINMGHVNADGFFASCVARYTQVRGGVG